MYVKRIIRYINDYNFEKVIEQIAQIKDRTVDETGKLIKFVLFKELLDKLDFCKESLVETYEDMDIEKFSNLDWYNIYKKLIDIANNIDEDLENLDGNNIRLEIFTDLTFSIGLYKKIEYNKNDLLERVVEVTKNSNEKYKDDKQELIYRIAEAFVDIKNFDRAMDFINNIEDEENKEELIINYINELINNKKLDEAEKLIEEKIKDTSTNYYYIYSDVIKTHFKLGNKEKSEELLEKIIKSSEKIKDKTEKEMALKCVVTALSGVKRVNDAIKLASKLSNRTNNKYQIDIRDNAFLKIIIDLSEDFEFEKASELIPNIKSDNTVFFAKLHIASNLAKAGKYDEAIKIAEEIKPEFIQKELALINIIKSLENDNYKDKANELKEKYKDLIPQEIFL